MNEDTPQETLNTFTVSVIIGGILLAILLSLGACKLPPIAVAYRGHSIFLSARDASGEALAKIQRSKMEQCEAKHNPTTPEGRAALITCLKAVRVPVALWVKEIKPAWTATAAAMWLAIEVAYAAGKSALDKLGKAALIACSGLKALGASVDQYKDRLGSMASILLTSIAAGRVLVCP
jgi:hypothetical protein